MSTPLCGTGSCIPDAQGLFAYDRNSATLDHVDSDFMGAGCVAAQLHPNLTTPAEKNQRRAPFALTL